MQIQIWCKTHNCLVIPAAEVLHMLPPTTDGWNEIDEGDLYCTNAGWTHEFEIRTI